MQSGRRPRAHRAKFAPAAPPAPSPHPAHEVRRGHELLAGAAGPVVADQLHDLLVVPPDGVDALREVHEVLEERGRGLDDAGELVAELVPDAGDGLAHLAGELLDRAHLGDLIVQLDPLDVVELSEDLSLELRHGWNGGPALVALPGLCHARLESP